jgi:predicted dehydrogenase
MTSGVAIGVGVIGLGFMGATHIAALTAAQGAGYPCRLVAVCDRKPGRRRGELWDVGGNAISAIGQRKLAFDPQMVRGCESPQAILDDPQIHLVCICTPTDTHVDLATRALRAGKHVLVEKPVSLRVDQIRQLDRLAKETTKLCMPAMCMRFWPAWNWLKQRIDDRTLGECVSATFTRLASLPRWSSFFIDGAKSGGALVDLHIHDADFVYWCFGRPEHLESVGRIGPSGAVDHVTTLYRFTGPQTSMHVSAEGGWDQHDGFAFRMRYVAIFEQATADFDLTRHPQLVLCRDGRAEPVNLPPLTGYDVQLRHIVEAINEGRTSTLAGLSDAAAVTELLDRERASVLEKI